MVWTMGVALPLRYRVHRLRPGAPLRAYCGLRGRDVRFVAREARFTTCLRCLRAMDGTRGQKPPS